MAVVAINIVNIILALISHIHGTDFDHFIPDQPLFEVVSMRHYLITYM